jgi:arylsulfatase A-like enzyme
MWTRRQLLASSFAFAQRRPNIVVILTDDQGYGDFSLRRNPILKTPNLDRLAGESVEFTRFSVSPVCAPTRAALMTGRYPLRTGVHGVTKGRETMRRNEVTIADCLKPAGYRTSLIGKWHLGENYPYVPHARGFDEFTGFRTGHWNWYFDSPVERNGKPSQLKGFIADSLTDEAIRFVRRPSSDPYFLYLAYNTPHAPYQVPDAYFNKFAGQGLTVENQTIYGMVSNLDDNIGRLLPNLDDNTIVMFLCDNGPQTDRFNAGLRGRKGSVYEGGTRSPLYVRYPAKLKGGRQISQIAGHIDIVPTLLDLAEVKRPSGPSLDGISLKPLLEGNTANWPARQIFTHADQQADPTKPYPGCVRDQQYKMVNGKELYDLVADPAEANNLAEKEPERMARMVRDYESWFASTLEGFKPGGPPIELGHRQENPTVLQAPQAELSGDLRFHMKFGYAHDFVTGWNKPTDQMTWKVDATAAGRYEATILYRGPKRTKLQLNALTGTTAEATNMEEIHLPHRAHNGAEAPVVHWSLLRLGNLKLSKGPTELKLSIQGASCDIKALEIRKV